MQRMKFLFVGYMEKAGIIERFLFPTNMLLIGGLVLILYMCESVNFLNNIMLFLTTFIIYAIIRKVVKGKIKDESRSFAIPAFISLFSFILLSYVLPVDTILTVSLISILIANSLVCFLRVKWKISAHCMALSLTVAILSFIDIRLVAIYILLPLVAWSRLKLKRHDMKQILAGSIAGTLIPIIVLTIIT